jgi:hypothetical protein
MHATCATVAFGLGCSLLAVLPVSGRSVRFVLYYIAAFAAVALLLAVVLVDWNGLPQVKRIAFGLLSVLALYLALRTEQARSALARAGSGWRTRFAGHVGFVLISLFDGFCIVSAIDLHLPPVVIALVAVLGVAAGILAIRRVARRERQADTAPSTAPE